MATGRNALQDGVNSSNNPLFNSIVDENGNSPSLSLQTDGNYHLGVDVTQSVYEDKNNSSTDNLTAANSYTFTGVGTSTLGVAGLQWSLNTDQNATVYIEESPDDINWDINYAFNYIESKGGRGETVQATQAYWRIRIVLINGTPTTYFRLSGILCPIATPLPSALSSDGRLLSESTITGQQNTERHVWISPTNTLTITPVYRLVGTNFDGTVKDPNFWGEDVIGTGTAAQSGGITLSTGTTANSTSSYYSIQRARFVVGSAMQFVGAFNFSTVNNSNNIRRLGAYDTNNGIFFQLDGSVFSVGSKRLGVVNLLSSGNFNGNLGAEFSPLADTYYKFDIEWTPIGVFFYVNGILLHKAVGVALPVMTFPIRFENINYNGNTVNVSLVCSGAVILRQGQLKTNPIYNFISTNTTTVLKYGAGNLHKIVNCDNAGTTTIYDNTVASGSQIAVIDTAKALGDLSFNAPFNNGLTVVTSGGAKVAIIYE